MLAHFTYPAWMQGEVFLNLCVDIFKYLHYIKIWKGIKVVSGLTGLRGTKTKDYQPPTENHRQTQQTVAGEQKTFCLMSLKAFVVSSTVYHQSTP